MPVVSFTFHGGGIEAARRQFGEGPWLDLSTGINPHSWPGVDAIDVDWRRLPEQDSLAALEAAAAEYFGTSPRHCCAVPGTETGLRLVGGLIGGEAHHRVPTYRTHGEMIAASAPIAGAALDVHDDTLILANPNNPDGALLSRDILLDLADRRRRNAWLLVDEAFADTDPEFSVADAIADTRRLIVFRSFGKFFGLAGVRLGFVLGPASIVAQVRSALGAWPVSAGAIAIGAAAYRDSRWISTMRRRLPDDSAKLDASLTKVGFTSSGTSPLFRLIDCDDAGALFERLARAAILTRPFSDNQRWLRIGLPGSVQDRKRLERALADG